MPIKLEHIEKQLFPILFTECKSIFDSEIHPSKALFSRYFTLFGILTVAKDTQFSNAELFMTLMLFGTCTYLSCLQLLKQKFPISDILSSKYIDIALQS